MSPSVNREADALKRRVIPTKSSSLGTHLWRLWIDQNGADVLLPIWTHVLVFLISATMRPGRETAIYMNSPCNPVCCHWCWLHLVAATIWIHWLLGRRQYERYLEVLTELQTDILIISITMQTFNCNLIETRWTYCQCQVWRFTNTNFALKLQNMQDWQSTPASQVLLSSKSRDTKTMTDTKNPARTNLDIVL